MRRVARSLRLGSEISRIIGEALVREVQDPALARVRITRVVVTEDMSHANAFYIAPPNDRVEGSLLGASGFFRSLCARKLRIRRVPILRFVREMERDWTAS